MVLPLEGSADRSSRSEVPLVHMSNQVKKYSFNQNIGSGQYGVMLQ